MSEQANAGAAVVEIALGLAIGEVVWEMIPAHLLIPRLPLGCWGYLVGREKET